ncbi:MAG: hypothetical protein WKF75_11185 [Singulisphaera sp.]
MLHHLAVVGPQQVEAPVLAAHPHDLTGSPSTSTVRTFGVSPIAWSLYFPVFQS